MATNIDLLFEWPGLSRYRIEPGRRLGTAAKTILEAAEPGQMIVGSGAAVMRTPLQVGKLYLEFLRDEPIEQTANRLVQSIGLLTARKSEPLSLWSELVDELKLIQNTANAFKLVRSRFDPADAALLLGSRLDVVLRPGHDGTTRLAFRPHNLREAIKLQCAHAIASGATLRACDECSSFFEAGGEGGKKSNARFCTDRCKDHFNNRRKLAERAKKQKPRAVKKRRGATVKT